MIERSGKHSRHKDPQKSHCSHEAGVASDDTGDEVAEGHVGPTEWSAVYLLGENLEGLSKDRTCSLVSKQPQSCCSRADGDAVPE